MIEARQLASSDALSNKLDSLTASMTCIRSLVESVCSSPSSSGCHHAGCGVGDKRKDAIRCSCNDPIRHGAGTGAMISQTLPVISQTLPDALQDRRGHTSQDANITRHTSHGPDKREFTLSRREPTPRSAHLHEVSLKRGNSLILHAQRGSAGHAQGGNGDDGRQTHGTHSKQTLGANSSVLRLDACMRNASVSPVSPASSYARSVKLTRVRRVAEHSSRAAHSESGQHGSSSTSSISAMWSPAHLPRPSESHQPLPSVALIQQTAAVVQVRGMAQEQEQQRQVEHARLHKHINTLQQGLHHLEILQHNTRAPAHPHTHTHADDDESGASSADVLLRDHLLSAPFSLASTHATSMHSKERSEGIAAQLRAPRELRASQQPFHMTATMSSHLLALQEREREREQEREREKTSEMSTTSIPRVMAGVTGIRGIAASTSWQRQQATHYSIASITSLAPRPYASAHVTFGAQGWEESLPSRAGRQGSMSPIPIRVSSMSPPPPPPPPLDLDIVNTPS